MPNPAVKPFFADGTTEGIRGRVGRCQNYIKKKAPCIRTGLFSCEAAGKNTGAKLRQKHAAGSGCEAIVKYLTKEPKSPSSRYAVEPGSIGLFQQLLPNRFPIASRGLFLAALRQGLQSCQTRQSSPVRMHLHARKRKTFAECYSTY